MKKVVTLRTNGAATPLDELATRLGKELAIEAPSELTGRPVEKMLARMIRSFPQMAEGFGFNGPEVSECVPQILDSRAGLVSRRKLAAGETTCLDLEKIRVVSGLTQEAFSVARKGFLMGLFAASILYGVEFTNPVAQVRKTATALGRGRKKKEQKTAASYLEIRKAVEERLRKISTDSLTYARQRVAENLGISLSTVKRATAGMKKPRK